MPEDRKAKSVGKKNILIMGKKAQTIELSTELGINYIPCCKIVLMFYNTKITDGFSLGY
jgi:hypothetical protein